MPRVLLICTGNICRSPIAVALLRQRLIEAGLSGWVIESAGTWTAGGVPASRSAVELMAEQGHDLSAHRSRAVDRDILQESDLVLVMTASHAEALRLEYPDQSGKVYLLSEMKDGRRYDIDDPFGRPQEAYQACIDTLADLIDAGFDRIRELAVQRSSTESGAEADL